MKLQKDKMLSKAALTMNEPEFRRNWRNLIELIAHGFAGKLEISWNRNKCKTDHLPEGGSIRVDEVM